MLLFDILYCKLIKNKIREKIMWMIIIAIMCLIFVSTITWLSYYLGCSKTENPVASGVIGFLLSFVPPLGLIYLIILSLKDEVSTV